MSTQEISPLPESKPNRLTPKNRLFLEYLLEGVSILEAHRKAGYKGGITSAYDLKHRLKDAFSILVNQRVSLTDALHEIERLDSLPMLQQSITLNQKIRLIQLKLQALKQVKEENKPVEKFTAFVINSCDGKTSLSVGEVQEAEVVEDGPKS